MKVEIRRATTFEVDAVVDLWHELIRGHRKFESRIFLSNNSKREYKKYVMYHIINPDSVLVVAKSEEDVLGYCLAFKYRNLPVFQPREIGYISDMSVRGTHKGKGIGSLLLEYVRNWFKDEGISLIQLQCYQTNEKGKEFWERHGFKTIFMRMQLNVGSGGIN